MTSIDRSALEAVIGGIESATCDGYWQSAKTARDRGKLALAAIYEGRANACEEMFAQDHPIKAWFRNRF